MDRRVGVNTGAAALFGLAIVCAVLAGFVVFDLGDSFSQHPPVNETAAPPGHSFAGGVGAQEAEIRNEYTTRSFEERLAQASSNESRAAVISAETRQLESRLEELEDRRNELSEGGDPRAYQTRVTSFVAQSRTLEHRFDRVQQAAETLPPSVREQSGLTEQTYSSLLNRTESLTTPEMRTLARQVAGDDVGDDLTEDDDDDRDEDESDGSDNSTDDGTSDDDEGGDGGNDSDDDDEGDSDEDSDEETTDTDDSPDDDSDNGNSEDSD